MDIKVHWVKSWRDIPRKDVNSTIHGWSEPKTGDIFAIEGKTSKADVEHEKYHILKKHPDNPRDYRDFVQQEIDATYYAYQKLGQPTHILHVLYAIYNDATKNLYHASHSVALNTIRTKLFALDIPYSWKEDYGKLVKEYNRVYDRHVILSEKLKPKLKKRKRNSPTLSRMRR